MESPARRLPRFASALALLIGQTPTPQAPSTPPEAVDEAELARLRALGD
jgi:hypothetical protein